MKQITQAGQSYPLLVRKSKFIGSAAPASSEQEARTFIEKIQTQQRKATHNCWAYRLIIDGNFVQNESDDGEPSGSAGQSILYVLEKQDIVNTVVVVTRFFGGVKLGKGGLVHAYAKATTTILEAIGTKPFNPSD
jgi:uncharacterized YigZ family protein